MKLSGLTADIYRNTIQKNSLNKLDGAKSVTVIDEQLCKLNEPTDTAPAVRLVRRKIFGRDYIHAEPFESGSYAFGGSFIFTSDSRLREINDYPIPLHDRQMNLEK